MRSRAGVGGATLSMVGRDALWGGVHGGCRLVSVRAWASSLERSVYSHAVHSHASCTRAYALHAPPLSAFLLVLLHACHVGPVRCDPRPPHIRISRPSVRIQFACRDRWGVAQPALKGHPAAANALSYLSMSATLAGRPHPARSVAGRAAHAVWTAPTPPSRLCCMHSPRSRCMTRTHLHL